MFSFQPLITSPKWGQRHFILTAYSVGQNTTSPSWVIDTDRITQRPTESLAPCPGVFASPIAKATLCLASLCQLPPESHQVWTRSSSSWLPPPLLSILRFRACCYDNSWPWAVLYICLSNEVAELDVPNVLWNAGEDLPDKGLWFWTLPSSCRLKAHRLIFLMTKATK